MRQVPHPIGFVVSHLIAFLLTQHLTRLACDRWAVGAILLLLIGLIVNDQLQARAKERFDAATEHARRETRRRRRQPQQLRNSARSDDLSRQGISHSESPTLSCRATSTKSARVGVAGQRSSRWNAPTCPAG